MAHNLVLENAAVNIEADALAAACANGYLRIYGGATQLAELRFGTPAFGAAVAGTLTAAAITKDSDADAAGTADSYRVYADDGATLLWTGTVGVTGGGFDLELDSVTIQQHAEVSLSAFTHTIPKS